MINHQRSVIWTLTAVITCTVSFFLLDGPIARLVYQNHTALTDSIFRPVTKLGESQGYLVAGALLYLLYRTRRPWMANAWLFLFSSVAVSGLASDLLKIILGRARPKLFLNDGIYGFDFFHLEHAWTSFPSGHATTALSAAVSLSLLYPRFRPLFLAAGFLIALSRIMLSQHYLSDVIAGGCLGTATVYLLYRSYFQSVLHGSTSTS
jgi:membrane-associated phospholipid phosphatase